jgi:hypothetical protein
MKYQLSKTKTSHQKLEDEMITFGWILLGIICLLGLSLIV